MSDMTYKHKLKEFRELCRDLQLLEQRALGLKLYVTARAINGAVRAAGWEKAGNLTLAIRRAIDRISTEGAP